MTTREEFDANLRANGIKRIDYTEQNDGNSRKLFWVRMPGTDKEKAQNFINSIKNKVRLFYRLQTEEEYKERYLERKEFKEKIEKLEKENEELKELYSKTYADVRDKVIKEVLDEEQQKRDNDKKKFDKEIYNAEKILENAFGKRQRTE